MMSRQAGPTMQQTLVLWQAPRATSLQWYDEDEQYDLIGCFVYDVFFILKKGNPSQLGYSLLQRLMQRESTKL